MPVVKRRCGEALTEARRDAAYPGATLRRRLQRAVPRLPRRHRVTLPTEQAVLGAGQGFAEQCLEAGEDLRNGIKVRAVGWQARSTHGGQVHQRTKGLRRKFMRYVAAFRTHVWDESVAQLASRFAGASLSSHFVILADETHCTIASAGYEKITHTNDMTHSFCRIIQRAGRSGTMPIVVYISFIQRCLITTTTSCPNTM